MKTILLIIGLLFLVGCQPTADTTPISTDFVTDQNIEIKLFSFGFEPNQISVEQGQKIRLVVTNTENIRHTFTLQELDIDVSLAGKEIKFIDFIADKSGTFEFFCTVPGHRNLGMEGELQVGTQIEELSEEDNCIAKGLNWKQFSNGCVDSCSSARATGRLACIQVITFGCDCGNSMCWNGNNCEVN